MNTTQTSQPLYSWIRGVDLTEPQLETVARLHEVRFPVFGWFELHSFAFTPEGRYLQAFKDAEPVSASISDSQP